MNSEIKNESINISDIPKVFIENITFNDGTTLSLNNNSIVVFTGANNCGKSQILREIENYFNKSKKDLNVILKNINWNFLGKIDNTDFFKKNFKLNSSGYYEILESTYSYTKETLINLWQGCDLKNDLQRLFIKRLNTELRLKVSNDLQRNNNAKGHPIYKLNNSEKLSQKVSEYFHEAFGEDLIINKNEISTIPLHVGQGPDKTEYTIATQDEYYNLVSKLPKLQEQGDGMRSFASILLDTFTSEYTITLIDEPEAFLHPPQARLLGKILVKNNPGNRQLFISTHSEAFLQGLLDADNENVIVIRIDRIDNINNMNLLFNDKIKKLWSNPLLRYSNILDGLFHEKVVVCESDYDCLFYNAIMTSIYESKGEVAPDILFTHCGGKSRVKDIVSSLKAVNVPVVAICDFDLLNSSQDFKPLIQSFGENWDNLYSSGMKCIYDNMNAKDSTGKNAWEDIKRVGKIGFTGDAPAAYEKVESICRKIGLFIVPVGEMECFDKTINKAKKEWVYHILENYDLLNEIKLNEAKKFVQAIVDFKVE